MGVSFAAAIECGPGGTLRTRRPTLRHTVAGASFHLQIFVRSYYLVAGSFPGQCLALLRTHTQRRPETRSRARGRPQPMPLEVAADGRHEADERARTGPPENS